MSLLTPLLWSFLPSQLAHLSLPYLAAILPSLFPPAPRGSPAYIRNYKLAFTLIISTWLAYTFVDDISGGAENWYTLLGVARDADDDSLKRAYRGLSRLHHPDRSGPNGGDETFIRIRQAYEVLSDPVRRYAYDRFGPQILNWKAVTVKEYIYTGLSHALGFYLVSGGIMLALSLLGRAKHGAYWRHTLFALLLFFELHLMLSPTSPTLSSSTYSPWSFVLFQPQFRRIELLHKAFTSLSVAITQLAGVWSSDEGRGTGMGREDASGAEGEEEWRRVVAALRGLEAEAVAGFQSEIIPLLSGTSSLREAKALEGQIQKGMEDILVEKTMSLHPHIRPTWLAATATQNHQGIQRQRQRNHIPPPALYPDIARNVSLGRGTIGKDKDKAEAEAEATLDAARSVPLPPSPPPSPSPRPSSRALRDRPLSSST